MVWDSFCFGVFVCLVFVVVVFFPSIWINGSHGISFIILGDVITETQQKASIQTESEKAI